MLSPNSDRTPLNLLADISPAVPDSFEIHDAEVGKSRHRRQPALSAGSWHDSSDHGRDRKPRGFGSRGSGSFEDAGFPPRRRPRAKPAIVEIRNWMPESGAVKRAAAEVLFTLRIFAALLTKLQRGDVALTVTAPFMLPYAVAAAARLKRARSTLIMHDLYPNVLIMAGISETCIACSADDAWAERADVP
jgi:hypothetical protein